MQNISNSDEYYIINSGKILSHFKYAGSHHYEPSVRRIRPEIVYVTINRVIIIILVSDKNLIHFVILLLSSQRLDLRLVDFQGV